MPVLLVTQLLPHPWVRPAAAQILSLAGAWDYTERVDVHCVVEGEAFDDDESGSGVVTVQQNGTTLSWSLSAFNLTRTATLDGNTIHFSGPFAIPLVGGVTFTSNSAVGTGTVTPNTEQIAFTGSGMASGTVCVDGECGSFSCTGTTQGAFRRPLLTVQKAGACSGTVTSSPAGIACGTDCAEGFAKGSSVRFTAVPDPGAVFGGWSGACAGTGACQITANSATTVGARFDCASPLVAAVLPGSRAVQVGGTATAFATVLNGGQNTLTNCSISRATSLPTSFLYQVTDPGTNALIGVANTPVTIPGGGGQTFLIALTTNNTFPATDTQFAFACAGVPAASVVPGLNTLLLTSTSTAGPDIVALGATMTNDGIANIPGTTGTGFFSVATVNVGASAQITATVDTGGATLPVVLSLCQTDPATAVCINPATPGSSVTVQVNANQTPTFAVFARGTGNVPFLPGVNRVFVRFKTAGGAIVGATSVALRTQ